VAYMQYAEYLEEHPDLREALRKVAVDASP
jgi:hypothetical protein